MAKDELVKVEIRKGVNYEGTLYTEKTTYDLPKALADALIDGEWARIAK